VLADARPAALLAPASLEVVLADARPAALFCSSAHNQRIRSRKTDWC
jgi:hypothetical protein